MLPRESKLWSGLALAAVVAGAACAPHATPEKFPWTARCDAAQLQAAARTIRGAAISDEGTTDVATRAILDACEVPEIEPFIALMAWDYGSYDWLPRTIVWDAMRGRVCPAYDEAAADGAHLPAEARPGLFWERCGFSRYPWADASRFAACGASPLPFVVYEILRASEVDEATASTLGRELCEHPVNDLVGRVIHEADGTPLPGATVTRSCGGELGDTVETNAEGTFTFRPRDVRCTLHVTLGHADVTREVGRKAAEQRGLVIPIDPEHRDR